MFTMSLTLGSIRPSMFKMKLVKSSGFRLRTDVRMGSRLISFVCNMVSRVMTAFCFEQECVAYSMRDLDLGIRFQWPGPNPATGHLNTSRQVTGTMECQTVKMQGAAHYHGIILGSFVSSSKHFTFHQDICANTPSKRSTHRTNTQSWALHQGFAMSSSGCGR